MGRLIDEHNEREEKKKGFFDTPKDHVELPPKLEKAYAKYTKYKFWWGLIRKAIGK